MILAITPLVLTYIDAPLDTIKTIGLVVTAPFMVIFGFHIVGMGKWLKADFSHSSQYDIEKYGEGLIASKTPSASQSCGH